MRLLPPDSESQILFVGVPPGWFVFCTRLGERVEEGEDRRSDALVIVGLI